MCLLNLHVQRFKASESGNLDSVHLCNTSQNKHLHQLLLIVRVVVFNSVSWPSACIEFTIAHSTASTACILTWLSTSTQTHTFMGLYVEYIFYPDVKPSCRPNLVSNCSVQVFVHENADGMEVMYCGFLFEKLQKHIHERTTVISRVHNACAVKEKIINP